MAESIDYVDGRKGTNNRQAAAGSGDTVRVGRLVSSVQGRDSGRFYLVVGIENDTILQVADGEGRKVENPKKKNIKHLKFYDALAGEVVDKFGTGRKITNADVRKAIKSLVGANQE